MNSSDQRYFGKYRGVVIDNSDPQMLGRIKVRVPDVLGDQESGWAMPCVPYAGNGVGFFFIPPTDASVWIEFERGDPSFPIWTGCFWGTGEVPASPAVAEMKVLKTDIATITINDQQGAAGVTIETVNSQKIKLMGTDIEIDNGLGARVKLSGPSVKINDQALEVT